MSYDDYNGDSVHDMWVDYTTDQYEGTDYSGENPPRHHRRYASAPTPRSTPSRRQPKSDGKHSDIYLAVGLLIALAVFGVIFYFLLQWIMG